jgi:drug/metabolite transporter (DMT)-like permease
MKEEAIDSALSVTRGRLLIAAGACLWSLNGAFAKVLTKHTFLHLDNPPVNGMYMAFFRAFFAGLALLPFLKRRDVSFRWMMVVMAATFAAMNVMFTLALVLGTTANAIYLQYTAPMWMYLASVWLLGEPPDRRSSVALVAGLAGMGIIICGGWETAQLAVIAIGLGSGVTFAGIILCLRVLRTASSKWLTVVNHICGALLILPFVIYLNPRPPTLPQLLVLFVFGAVQLGFPYLLVAKGMRSVSPQEAGTITLLEPLLSPLWAYLVSPATELPSPYTMIGGAFILGGLGWRYWPRR